jgi:kinesin family protein 2/24
MKVYVRKRPSRSDKDVVSILEHNIKVSKKSATYNGDIKIINHTFRFDSIFNSTVGNRDLFKCTLQNYIHKDKIVCFTYGQTGSGKTYTLFGNHSEYGLIQLAYLAIMPQELEVVSYEIYNNDIFDLINDREPLKMMESDRGHSNIANASVIKCSNVEDFVYYINYIKEQRSVSTSSQNSASSRSHAIVKFKHGNKELMFVDLAGSERARQNACNSNEHLKENALNNKGIFALKECIRAMRGNNKYIPFRLSPLTMILRDAFRSDCTTVIFGTVNCEPENYADTVDTLKYLQQMNGLAPVISTVVPKNEENRENRENKENSENGRAPLLKQRDSKLYKIKLQAIQYIIENESIIKSQRKLIKGLNSIDNKRAIDQYRKTLHQQKALSMKMLSELSSS